jgi:MscS family membrane protein
LSWVTRKILARFQIEAQGQHQLARPLGLLWGAIVGRVLVAALGLPLELGRDCAHVLNVVVWLATFWTVAAVVEGVRWRLAQAPWAANNAGSRALIQLATRVVKLVLFIVATIGALSQIGVPVTSLLAGLGVGGLGLALAAQKTVENLFGAFSIGVDQPFREGDTITVDGVTGTVERIGLRSTRIRSAERTVIAIPNGKLADMKTENFTARDRFRLAMTLGLSYATTAEQVQKIVDGVTKLLGAHPKVYSDVSVQLSTLSMTSVNIDVSCTFRTSDAAEFLAIKQQVLLQMMSIVQDAGASLAAPPQRLQLVSDGTQVATPTTPNKPV